MTYRKIKFVLKTYLVKDDYLTDIAKSAITKVCLANDNSPIELTNEEVVALFRILDLREL
jgi:hypothetical protein